MITLALAVHLPSNSRQNFLNLPETLQSRMLTKSPTRKKKKRSCLPRPTSSEEKRMPTWSSSKKAFSSVFSQALCFSQLSSSLDSSPLFSGTDLTSPIHTSPRTITTSFLTLDNKLKTPRGKLQGGLAGFRLELFTVSSQTKQSFLETLPNWLLTRQLGLLYPESNSTTTAKLNDCTPITSSNSATTLGCKIPVSW